MPVTTRARAHGKGQRSPRGCRACNTKPSKRKTAGSPLADGPRKRARGMGSGGAGGEKDKKSDGDTETRKPDESIKHHRRPDEIKEEASTPEAGPSTTTINRAPVLWLWGASVAGFLHPDLSWDVCLAVGSSISRIIAVSKGRSIGTISEPSETSKKGKGKETQDGNGPSFRVMGFPMTVKDGGVLVKGKVTRANEENLVAKFGDEDRYNAAQDAMRDAPHSWSDGDAKEELDKHAFHMYEEFRPWVPRGQTGWGRKGTLDLKRVGEAVRRRSDN